MLKRFEVHGFKQFQHLTLDFANVRDYAFNTECTKNGLVKDAIIYGRNASGKTNLGLAIFDIIAHLTDMNSGEEFYTYYLKADSPDEMAAFSYEFLLGNGHCISYNYQKGSHHLLYGEELKIDGQEVLRWSWKEPIFIDLDFSGTYKFGKVNWASAPSELSVVKYIFNNMISSPHSVMAEFRDFVNGMLWFQRNDINNRYIGLSNSREDIYDYIVKQNLVSDFEHFLQTFSGIDGKLKAIQGPDGRSLLYLNYENPLPLNVVASSGTRALSLFYYWLKHKRGIKFVFIDEFDAFYHYALSENILRYLIKNFDGQALLTTHNINLLTNKIIRPDCSFIVNNGKIKSLSDSTRRELREGSNLERLYVSGEFDG